MIPTFKKKIAMRADRPKFGPNGCPRRRIHLIHQCYAALFSGWNTITANVKLLQWADGIFRRSMIFLAGLLADQPEADAFCAEGSQTCKTCRCPKDRLTSHVQYPLKNASEERRAVHNASVGLFTRDRRRDVAWKKTSACSNAAYERKRTQLNGKHLMENAFWERNHFDVQLQVRMRTY